MSEPFTRSIIEDVFNPLNLFIGYFTKVRSFGSVLLDESVCVFIRSALPRIVEFTKIEIYFQFPRYFLVFYKFLSIISVTVSTETYCSTRILAIILRRLKMRELWLIVFNLGGEVRYFCFCDGVDMRKGIWPLYGMVK